MNAADLAKLEGYVSHLEKKAAEEDKNGEYVEEIATCLKLVDVLLVYAEAAPDYPRWVKCTDKATGYQKKIRSLISLASLKQKQQEEEQIRVPHPSSGSKNISATNRT
jgi:hypothetical protein